MDIQTLKEKIDKKEPLSPEEQQFFLNEINTEFLSLKQKDPEKYLQYLKGLNEIFGELNQSLKSAVA